MANVLDLRRRIRSVKNTRQITKAMKMVSAAKLRRAQERALAARPYAKMITSVLESLTRRVDIFDEETGNLRHPLFAVRPEKRVLLVVISGDKGFAGAFNANIFKMALPVHHRQSGQGNRCRGSRPQGSRSRCAAAFRPRSTSSRPTRTATSGRCARRARARSRSRATIRECCSSSKPARVFELAREHHLPLCARGD